MENQERRKFLKTMGALSASALFSSCASIDRWVLGEDRENPQRVIVLGGGLAGLVCAYNFKKSQIPFLLIEGSSRLGGRAYSLSEFNSASQTAELGGEWILPSHESILHLCKELNLELSERTWSGSDFGLYRDNKWSEGKKLERELKFALKEIQNRKYDIFGRTALRLTAFNGDEIPKAKLLDQQNAEEYLRSLPFSSDVKALFSLSLQTQFGVMPEKLSALSVFQLSAGTSAQFPGVEHALRLGGGSSALVRALTDRVAGVIPGRFLQTEYKLIEIDKSEDVFELKFQTPEGVRTKTAKTVVSTLPHSVLKEIKGFQKLQFPEPVMKALENLRYGDLAKGAMAFSDRIWQKNLDVTRWWSTSSQSVFNESEPRKDRPHLTPKAILSFQMGAGGAAAAGMHTIEALAKELTALKMQSALEDSGQIFNWSQSPWSRGGVSYWGPGSATKFAGLLADSGSAWIFAGEHTSLLYQGTMNGAVESAANAVRRVQHLLSKT